MIQSKDFMSCSKLQQVLAEIARNVPAFYRSPDQAEWAALSRFLMPGSSLQCDRVVPAFKPLFDIIHRIAREVRARDSGRHIHAGTSEDLD